MCLHNVHVRSDDDAQHITTIPVLHLLSTTPSSISILMGSKETLRSIYTKICAQPATPLAEIASVINTSGTCTQ